MKPDEVSLFRTLEPPPGGVERFSRRLEDEDATPRRLPGRRMLAAGLAAALIAVVVIAVNQAPRGGDLQNEGDAAPPIAENDAPAATDLSADRARAADRGGATDVAAVAEIRDAPAFARLLGQPVRPAETSIAIGDEQVAVAEIPSTNSKIRIYQIGNN